MDVRLGYPEVGYNLFDEAVVRSIPGYKVLEITDVLEQERTLLATVMLANSEAIPPECYVLLRRR